MRGRLAFLVCALVCASNAACGARSGLLVVESSDAGVDAPGALDATALPDTTSGRDTAPSIDSTLDVARIDSAPADAGIDVVVDLGPPDAPLEPLKLSLGDVHTCALRADGSVWCWGDAEHFGGGAGEVAPTPRKIDAFAGAKQIVAGIDQTCAVISDGSVQCMGWSIGGPFAGPPARTTTPTPVPGLDEVVELALGGSLSCTYACARRTDGTAMCWGCNTFGMLGDGTTTDRATPAPVAGLSGVAQIAAKPSSLHTCARLDDGTAKCWGLNEGQIGDGTATMRTAPTSVTDLSSVAEIAAGYSTSFARQVDGTTLGWGNGSMGELGIGKDDFQPTAAIVPGIVADRIAVGMYHTCALQKDSSLECWGNNDAGQVGDGTTTERDAPVVVYAKGVVDVALGTAHTCARLADGSLWCWGSNSSSNLGDGVTPAGTSSPTPVRVKGF